ncbi:MAG: DUF2007 domain-containing protein [Tannerella sp.]|jgi:hypothetical protein|nr:DUF2007 domain-containing protein [Tannerella sp.]
MEHLVEIANFAQSETAEMLAALLRAEGIACTTRNEVSSRVFRGVVDIGVRVEVLEHNVPRALEILNGSGFSQQETDDVDNCVDDSSAGLARYLPLLRKHIIILIALIAGMLAILVCLHLFMH